MEFVGKTVRKEFKGFGVFSGIIKSFDSSTGFFEIIYEDGSSEEVEFCEIALLLEGNGIDQHDAAELGNKPKKRQRFEIPGDSGNASVNLLSSSCLNQRKEELGVVENCKNTVLLNRNVDINASCDGVDLNSKLNLNDGLNLNVGSNANHGLDLNVGLSFDDEVNLDESGNLNRSNFIDLNLDINEEENGKSKPAYLRGSVVDTQTREHCFDLNLGLDDETKDSDADCDGRLKKVMAEETQVRLFGENVGGTQVKSDGVNGILKGVHLETVEGTSVKGFSGSTRNLWVDVIPKEDGVLPRNLKRGATFGVVDANFVNDTWSSEIQLKGQNDAGTQAILEYHGNSGSSYNRSNSRKRTKLSDSVYSGREIVLRRSTRRGRADFSAKKHVPNAVGSDAVNDEWWSPVVSAVSEEKDTDPGCEESEECNILPPKLQLPPSSENLDVAGIPILELFSVYAFLRSFSTLLFLSPFELEDFVAALRCEVPNLLVDFIHVSLLQTLRKHLVFLSDESSQSASLCLRNLDWDLLDLITWPIFMVEYLLMHTSGLKPGFDLCHLKLFEGDYYKQPTSIKIEILRCLCDDVIEVEVIRSELNRRKLVTEPFENSKKKLAAIDVCGGSYLTEEVVDETTDWNGDECYLCKMDGSLICCDGCPAAFHSRCVGVASSLLPEGDWYCPECVVDRDKPWMRVGNSIRGAELLGFDPDGRLYYSSCGYLLVSDSCDPESSVTYYHRNDLTVVIEALKSSDIRYSTIISAITKLWNVTTEANGGKADMDSQNVTLGLDFLMKRQMPATSMIPMLFAPSETCVEDETANEGKPEENSISAYSANMGCEIPELLNVNPVNLNHSMKMENILGNSEGSAEISQGITGIQNFEKTRMDCSYRSGGILNDSEAPGKSISVGAYSLTSTNLEVEKGKNIQSAARGCTSSTISTRGNMSRGLWGINYVNYYSFARIASSVAEELTRKPSEKISSQSTRSVEEMVSAHLKVISNVSTLFCWSNIQNLNVDARKEKCGWCFSCKDPDDDKDCLFIINDTGPVLGSFTSELLGIHPINNIKGHLIDVMCHILYIEDRLHGLLLGPWLNPHYSKLLRKAIFRAFDVASVKHLLLMLESNLHRRALSAEWLKHVDTGAAMGSASHVMTNSSKHGIGRKRARCSVLEPGSSSKAVAGLRLFWWRGGRLSRHLFNWKVLPRSLASKAARQAGYKKIPGVLYPDSSEFAKRSKYDVWRASVETSRSAEQLALQVRELDANIRWDDVENTSLISKMDKESRKSIRSFKKVVVRRKCSEGTVAKYLLDFGKRRFIPNVVARHGSMLEESSSGRKKFWLEESYVPLHLLKVFEDKRISRKSNKMSPGKLHESSGAIKKPSKGRGFSYLFSKAERSENYQCGHCNRDVLIREAVSCQYCKGFFHKRHARKSVGAISAKCTYTCHKCQDGKYLKVDTKKGKSQSQRSKKASIVLRPECSKISRKAGTDKQTVQSQNNRKDSVVVPLRRSARKIKYVPLNIKGRNKGKQTKSRKRTLKEPKKGILQKKRTRMYHTYWMNGLLLSRKPNDEGMLKFRSENFLAPSEQFSPIIDQPKCSLCCEPEFTSTLNYIRCEICRDWFHGDAFGLRAENIGNLIGFKCHKCRNRIPPVCPCLNATGSDNALLGVPKNDAGIEHAEEVSDGLALPKEQAGTIPDSNQALALDAEKGNLQFRLGQRTEAIHNSKEKDWKPPDILMQSGEKTSLEGNSIKLGEGPDENVTTLVETESPLPKSHVDITGKELAS